MYYRYSEGQLLLHVCMLCGRQVTEFFIAELQRAKRASGAPWVRKFGNHVIVRPSVRPFVQTLGEGEGSHRTITALVITCSI